MPALQENKWEFCSRDYAQAGFVVAASSLVGAGGFPVSNVLDGDRLSMVRYSGSLPASVTIDLGAVREFNRVFVRCPMFFGISGLNLSISDDNINYVSAPASWMGSLQLFTLRFARIEARYCKIEVTGVDNPAELRITEIAVFASQFTCDGLHGSLDSSMPYNPQARSMESVGRVLVPLLHGNNFRLQSWGAERRTMTLTFPLVMRRFVDLMEYYKDRGAAFGLVTHEFEFHNLIIVPGGWRVNELPSDGPGATTLAPDRTEPSKTWYNVELQVQEVYSPDAVTEEEPLLSEEGGDIVMQDVTVVP